MQVLRGLWNDEAGFVVSAELVLVATILVIGMIVGLTSLRNQTVEELVDVGQAVGYVSQGYEYYGVSKVSVANTDGSGWDDLMDFCQMDLQFPEESPGWIAMDGSDGIGGTLPPRQNLTPGEDQP